MANDKCPCVECICIPVCRARTLETNITLCSLLEIHIDQHSMKFIKGGMRLIEQVTLNELYSTFKWNDVPYKTYRIYT